VTVDLSERGKGNELILTHERFPSAGRTERHKRGWSQLCRSENLPRAGPQSAAPRIIRGGIDLLSPVWNVSI
jgi:hypothetical protein